MDLGLNGATKGIKYFIGREDTINPRIPNQSSNLIHYSNWDIVNLAKLIFSQKPFQNIKNIVSGGDETSINPN